jgi:hypothetical protein
MIKAFRVDAELKKELDTALKEFNNNEFITIGRAEFMRQAIIFYINYLKTKQIGFVFKDK